MTRSLSVFAEIWYLCGIWKDVVKKKNSRGVLSRPGHGEQKNTTLCCMTTQDLSLIRNNFARTLVS